MGVRVSTWLVVGASIAALAAGAWQLSGDRRAPPPPQVDAGRAGAAVAAAIDAARADVLASPASATTWGSLGAILLVHGFRPEARSCLLRARQIDPRDVRWPYLLGCTLSAEDPACREAFETAAAVAPTEPAPRSRLSELLLHEGDLDGARREATAATKLDEDDPRAQFVLGSVARAGGASVDARAHFERALRGAPAMRRTHVMLAEVCAALGDAEASALHAAKARVLSGKVRWPDAIYDPVFALSRSPADIITLAEALTAAGRTEEAGRRLRAAVAADPEVSGLRLALAMHLVAQRDGRGAEETIRPVVARDPQDVGAQYALGCSLALQGRLPEAEEHLRVAVDLEPDLAAAHYDLAQCLEERGARDEALSSYQAALESDARHVDAARRAGALLFALRRYDEAVEMLDRALALDGRDRETRALRDRAAGHVPR